MQRTMNRLQGVALTPRGFYREAQTEEADEDAQDEREYSRAPELENLHALPSPWTVYRNMTDKDLRSVFT
jgi:hypothetical protein